MLILVTILTITPHINYAATPRGCCCPITRTHIPLHYTSLHLHNFSCNILSLLLSSLTFTFQSVEHHLSSTKPHLLFLTETQLSVTTDSNPFSVSSYFLYPHFQSKAGCCVYVHNNITCSRAHNLESAEFSTIWLRLQCYSN